MMHPVRTTLLLTVDENTARKFLRDEASIEGAQTESRPSRWQVLIHRLRQLRSLFAPRRNRIEPSPRNLPMGGVTR